MLQDIFSVVFACAGQTEVVDGASKILGKIFKSRDQLKSLEDLQQAECTRPKNIHCTEAVNLNISYHEEPMGFKSSTPSTLPRCPLLNDNIVSITLGHSGGVLTGKGGSIELTIPKGAIKDGDSVTIYIAVDWYGPFLLPSNCQADVVSPYYWIGVSDTYHFHKPVQIEFEHFGACDPSHYKLLTCEDNDQSYNMQWTHNYKLSFEVQDDVSLCRFSTNHFCSYCLFHDYKDESTQRIAAFYLQPKNIESLNKFRAEIWFSLVTNYCLTRNKELYEKQGMKLKYSYSSLVASTDKNSTNFLALKYHRSVHGWCIRHNGSPEIKTNEIYCRNSYKDADTLRISEEQMLFPPRFILEVTAESACGTNLNTDIQVALYNSKEDKRLLQSTINFVLFHEGFSCKLKDYATVPDHCDDVEFKGSSSKSKDYITLPCDHICNKPDFGKLLEYSDRISLYWDKIAYELKISEARVEIIDVMYNHPNDVEKKYHKMIMFWLQDGESPCWCRLIQALYAVGLREVAKEATTYLQNHDQDLVCTAKRHKPNLHPFDNTYGSYDSATETALRQINKSSLKDKKDPFKFFALDFVRYLKPIAEDLDNLKSFVFCLLPIHRAENVINEIDGWSDGSSRDVMLKVCIAFLDEYGPSWTIVHSALKGAGCDSHADIVEAFLKHAH